jgi:tRNA A-37 threonylcarbamoyl transferase component Bud32
VNEADENLMTLFTAALECGTAGERAAYLDRACASSPGLRERVEALLRAHNRGGDFLGGAPPDQTVTFVSTPGPGVQLSSRAYGEEVRRLLRSRLILAHLLGLAFIAMISALSFVAAGVDQDPTHRPDQGTPWLFVPLLAQCLTGAAVLWRSPRMSLRSLRRWELAHFAAAAAFWGLYRFDLLAHVAGVPNPSTLAIGNAGGLTLFPLITLILAYGVLVPNTRRRSLLGVAGLTAVPFAAVAAAVAVSPALGWPHFVALVVQAAANLVFPAAIAVFAATRAADLQRRAFEAERRADQFGQYTLTRKLGEGGMGEVFLAEHRLLKRPCAVKFVRPELAAHPATAARFAREVQAVTGLTHANTVRVYDYGRADDGSFYYVMEYLDGPTLDRLVADHGPLPPGRVVHLLRQLCGALAEAHAAGLVHRDVKPGNVIVARLGGVCDVAKLLDFGLVLDESAADGDDRLTRAGVVLGTPAYMAPEQAAGEPVDARGDVYSLGAVAYYALTGRPPFGGKNARQVMAAHRTEPVTPLDGVPGDLAAVVARCLAKDPTDRFQSAADLDRALGQCSCASARPTGTAAELSAEQKY